MLPDDIVISCNYVFIFISWCKQTRSFHNARGLGLVVMLDWAQVVNLGLLRWSPFDCSWR